MKWGLDSNPSHFGGKRVLSRTLLLESSTMQWIVNSPQMSTCLTLCFPVSSKLISDGRTSSSLLDASNRFYTLIPHDFGMKKPPLLDNLELIKVRGLNWYHFLNTLLLRGERQRNGLKCKTSLMTMAFVILWCACVKCRPQPVGLLSVVSTSV